MKRKLSPPIWKRMTYILTACLFLTVPIQAQKVLDPDKPIPAGAASNSGTITDKNGNKIPWKAYGWLTTFNYNDGDQYEWFEVVNNTITLEDPSIYFQFCRYDGDRQNYGSDGKADDVTYSIGFFIQYQGETKWHLIAWSGREHYDLRNVATSHGYVTQDLRHFTITNNGNASRWRFYPSHMGNQNKRIAKGRLVSYWDADNDGGSYISSYGNTSKRLDWMQIHTFDIKYDDGISGIHKGIFSDQPNKVALNVNDINMRTTLLKLNQNWKYRTEMNQVEYDSYWGNLDYTATIEYQDKSVPSLQVKGTVKGKNGKVSFNNSLNSPRYDLKRCYTIQTTLKNTSNIITNSYETNYVHHATRYANHKYDNGWMNPYAHADTLFTETYMWDKKVHLAWTPDSSEVDSNGKWYVYRYIKSEGPSSRVKLKELGYGTTQYTDSEVPAYNVTYVYEVAFGPKTWGTLDEPEPSLTKSIEVTVIRDFPMTLSLVPLEKNGVSDGMQLTWEHSPVKEKEVTFLIHRREVPSGATSSDIPFTQIASVERTNADTRTHTYIDKEPSSLCTEYQYKVTGIILDSLFTSNHVTGSIARDKGSRVKSVTASKGSYDNMVQIAWEAQQVGNDATKYVVLRRLLGSGGEFSKIYTTQGIVSEYFYEDRTVFPGNYYEYKVEAHSICDEDKFILSNHISSEGFCQSRGTISGRITYGTGVAVEGVKMVLTQSSDDYTKNQFYALLSKMEGGGISYTLTDAQAQSLFGEGQSSTLQLWLNPSSANVDANGKYYNPAILATEAFMLYGKHTADKGYQLVFQTNNANGGIAQTVSSNLYAAADQYTHISLGLTENKLTLYLIGKNGKIHSFTQAITSLPLRKDIRTLRVGSALRTSEITPFTFNGHLDEVRAWNKELTEKEILNNYNRLLAGSEKNLKIYWPVDEGINGQTTAYDYSKTDGVPNECHGTILTGTEISTTVPTSDQFSLYGLTDPEGNYVIRGIPFAGEGTNYVVTPTMGIHEFSPKYVTRFVSSNSLNHSGTDMQDVSSFEVSGKVYYEGTLYPVQGANLYIDGAIANRDGKAIETDEAGEFTISVPIGDHHITIQKQDHTFVNEGRYPADRLKHTFNQPISNLTFYDNTLVTVAGRITGGTIEGEKPIGLGRSKNTIGEASIVLTTGYQMNMLEKKEGTVTQYENNPENLTVSSPTAMVNSTAYRMGGDDQAVRKIVIQTDPQTGEFAAQLPPVLYNVESIQVETNKNLKFDNLPDINASNPTITYTDSAEVDDKLQKFVYTASMIHTYREAPTFTVNDKGADEGAFGEKSYTLTEANGNKTNLQFYHTNNGKVTYTYGNPIFIQGNPYTFQFEGYEEYVNNDGDTPVKTRVPLNGTVVTIENQMSAENGVRGAEDENPGEIGDLKVNQLTLDSLGKATYKFQAGFPNILEDQGFARGLNISFENNGQEVNWSGSDTFKGVILGSLPTGSNFVTAGPDKVEMILRDPPGTGSYSYWNKGSTVTHTNSYSGEFISGTDIQTVTRFGFSVKAATGSTFFYAITQAESRMDMTVATKINTRVSNADTEIESTTTTQGVNTSDSPDYVGAQGDVFIGRSTNTLFGNARSVTFIKSGGGYQLGVKDSKVTGSTFGTEFNYTQYYVENVLIPNMQDLRNSMITPVSESEYANYVNRTKKTIYISKLSPDDEKFGSSNNDKEVWGNQAISDPEKLEGPSYKMLPPTNSKGTFTTDSVHWYNQQITLWEQQLYENEKAKVTAIENRSEYLKENISLDAGSIIENSIEKLDGRGSSKTVNFETVAYGGFDSGFSINDKGVLVTFRQELGGGYVDEEGTSNDSTKVMGYTLAEAGFNDAITVDVYNAPDGFGPIFVTRGGQTSCPYEGEVVTRYYRPGTVISTSTMQVEIPEITATNVIATDVPTGGSASYELKIANLSETNDDIWFDLALVDETNPNGAKLSIDGAVLTTGRTILVPAGKTVIKTLRMEQTDMSILDYEDIQLVLKSQCQGDPTGIFPAIADTLSISAHFVPSCSNITLSIDNRTMNTTTGSKLAMEIADIDRNYRSFKGFRIEYRFENDADWSLAKEYVMYDKDKTNNNERMPEGSPIDVVFDMSNNALFPDGKYVFRAVTKCDFGNGEINNESEEIVIIKDMNRPQLLGSANPADGILRAGEDIYVTFNEGIRSGALQKDNNFIVTGVLNGAKVDHQTTLQLNGAKEAAAITEADILLSNQSFASDVWINAQCAGTIWEHGSAQSKFSVGINTNKQLTVSIGEQTYTSENTVPQGKWIFLSLVYEYKAGASLLHAQVAHDAETISLFQGKEVADYSGNGRLAVGKLLTGAIHELTLWNRARTLAESHAEMHITKKPATPNLIGYWKMDEGNGKTVRDIARNRHMTSSGNWALNNVNYSAAFNGNSSFAALDITACSTLETDDYALEFWFKGGKQTKATLFSVSDRLSLRANEKGYLSLVTDGMETQLSSTDYLDGEWHHFALNVLRTGVSRVYIDGTGVMQLSSAGVPPLQGNTIILGADRKLMTDTKNTSYSFKEYFKGEIDEVRFWNASLTGPTLDARRYTRIDTTQVAGLVAYYPFETRMLDSNNQVVTQFTYQDQSVNRKNATATSATQVSKGKSAPGLKEAPTATNLQFSYTASDKQVFINLLDDAARLEGTTVNITLRNVYDLNNNLMSPIVWSAYISQNRLKWVNEEISLTRTVEDKLTPFGVTISNSGSENEQWSISHVPAWLEVSETQGSLRPLASRELTFAMTPATPAGKYEGVIYLSGNNGINVPLTVTLRVTENEPDWNVDESDYELSMNLIGQLQVDGIATDDTDDVIAAYVGERCVGIGSPIYYPRYDAYYVHLTVFGNEEDLSKPVTFKMWDASTGDIYPQVTASTKVTFISNQITGSMSTPLVWNAKEQRKQKLALNKGWNWISLHVVPEDASLDAVFGKQTGNLYLIKDHTSFAVVEDGKWTGSMERMTVGKLYKIQTLASTDVSVYGRNMTSDEASLSIVNNWNWIGFNAPTRMSVDDAFAGLRPKTGDVVKNRNKFSVYEDYQWVGTLASLIPGQGYMYQSQVTAVKSFHYPTTGTPTPANASARSLTPTTSVKASLQPQAFTPVSTNKYTGTMTVIAQVMRNGQAVNQAEVSAFVGSECRGAIRSTDAGLCFLTVHGEATTKTITFKVNINGQLLESTQTLDFVEDSMKGKVKEPYVIYVP